MPSTWLARADMGLGVNAIHICTMHLVSMGSVPVTVIHICTISLVIMRVVTGSLVTGLLAVTVIHMCTMRIARVSFAEYGFFKAPMPSKARTHMGLGGQRRFGTVRIAGGKFAKE